MDQVTPDSGQDRTGAETGILRARHRIQVPTSVGPGGGTYSRNFFKPNVATNANKWLLDRIREELQEFQKPGTRRVWPDIWIVATNIDPSGTPNTGVFDASREEVEKARPQLKNRFAIWGGRKILDLLVANPDIAEYYSNVLRPVHSSMLQQLSDQQANRRKFYIT